MYRFLISTVTGMLFCTLLYSQGSDTLYLKNGSVAAGKLQHLRKGGYQIKTNEGMTFVFAEEDILRFTVVGNPAKTEEKIYDLSGIDGLGFVITSSLLLGSSEDNFPIFGTQNLIMTYAFSPEHVAGLGTGIELLDRFHIPVFLEYRYGILKRNVSPFLYLRGGKLFTLKESGSDEVYHGGWTIGGGTGYRWPVHTFESYIRLGYRYGIYLEDGKLYEYSSDSEYPCTFRHTFHRLEVGWGFRF
ncbi:MAG TPA: hypothetical protein PLV06_00815 [Bacteroidales bacterium]|nr:hypothetical protein [Bacteroidales bacterium]HPF04313.1 hypothetical protein [Bacteroidales bacterium]HPJ58296.1 hypothetical protein [Bacteroidales bacterium]HPR10898.1 hypothetical protein [Bacteroidales bacterium]HRW84142.1 hypothetical protein [Bacteroidales bacterium]